MSDGELGAIRFVRKRGSVTGALVCFALSAILLLALGLNWLSSERLSPDAPVTGFVLTSAALALLGWRFLRGGTWFHERGVRLRGVWSGTRFLYRDLRGLTVSEFTTSVNGVHDGYSVVMEFVADGKLRRIALADGRQRDPDAAAILALMRGAAAAVETSPLPGRSPFRRPPRPSAATGRPGRAPRRRSSPGPPGTSVCPGPWCASPR